MSEIIRDLKAKAETLNKDSFVPQASFFCSCCSVKNGGRRGDSRVDGL